MISKKLIPVVLATSLAMTACNDSEEVENEIDDDVKTFTSAPVGDDMDDRDDDENDLNDDDIDDGDDDYLDNDNGDLDDDDNDDRRDLQDVAAKFSVPNDWEVDDNLEYVEKSIGDEVFKVSTAEWITPIDEKNLPIEKMQKILNDNKGNFDKIKLENYSENDFPDNNVIHAHVVINGNPYELEAYTGRVFGELRFGLQLFSESEYGRYLKVNGLEYEPFAS